jgi:hypothetical protein
MITFESGRFNSYHRSDTGRTFMVRNFAGGDQYIGATAGMAMTAWNHIAWTNDGVVGTSGNFYGNGQSVTTNIDITSSGALSTTSSAFVIGNNTTGASPGGTIAYVSLYNVVLTQSEVREAMTYGYTPRGLIGYWPVWGTDSPEPDYSGLGRVGSITAGAAVAGPPVAWPLLPQATLSGFAADASTSTPAVTGGGGNLALLGVG